MKQKQFWCIILILCCSSWPAKPVFAQHIEPTAIQSMACDSVSADTFNKLVTKNFINNTVSNFFNAEYAGCYLNAAFITEPPNKLAYLSLNYGKGITIEIVPRELQFQKRFSKNNSWDFELFKKERIATIRLLYKGKVILAE